MDNFKEKILAAIALIETGEAYVFVSGRKWEPLKEIPDGLAYLARTNCIKSRAVLDLRDPDDELLGL